LIKKIAIEGYIGGKADLFVDIRKLAEDQIAKLITLESKLEQLDKNSPCLKCKQIKEEAWKI
jgi:hypothetical protein